MLPGEPERPANEFTGLGDLGSNRAVPTSVAIVLGADPIRGVNAVASGPRSTAIKAVFTAGCRPPPGNGCGVGRGRGR
jgi:hypothetical protein